MIIALILQKGFRKQCAIVAVAALCFNFMWNSVLLPAWEITPGSRREMLSIPFQQTARYVRDAPEDITEEEKAAISAVLDFDKIGEVYNPVLSDPVKVTFNEKCTTEELMEYFKVWFRMLWKHPGIYIQATMNNKYEMFFPSAKMFDYFPYATSENRMNMYNDYYDQTDFDFHYPDTYTTQRNNYELLREKIYRLPILSTMMIPAAYTWTLFVWLFYCIRKKNNTSISLMLPLFVQMLIIIAGPCNGSYIRYLYPYIICVPLLMFIGNKLLHKDAGEKEDVAEADNK